LKKNKIKISTILKDEYYSSIYYDTDKLVSFYIIVKQILAIIKLYVNNKHMFIETRDYDEDIVEENNESDDINNESDDVKPSIWQTIEQDQLEPLNIFLNDDKTGTTCKFCSHKFDNRKDFYSHIVKCPQNTESSVSIIDENLKNPFIIINGDNSNRQVILENLLKQIHDKYDLILAFSNDKQTILKKYVNHKYIFQSIKNKQARILLDLITNQHMNNHNKILVIMDDINEVYNRSCMSSIRNIAYEGKNSMNVSLIISAENSTGIFYGIREHANITYHS
jgi:hypothetical protein